MRKRIKNTSRVMVLEKRASVTWLWIGLGLALLALISLGTVACSTAPVVEAQSPATEISVDEAYQLYQEGTFFLDVRTQEEWDDFHAPNSTLIPLDQLGSRLNELPQDEQIVVVCRSGNRSQAGRDILLSNGFEGATSMSGGLNEWRSAGYPIE